MSRRRSTPHIVADDEQAKIILESAGSIEIRDRSGKQLGYVAHGFTDEDIAVAKQRRASDQPRFTTGQVLDHIESFQQK